MFSADEIATIRKFFDWIEGEEWLENRYSSGEGLIAADDEGLTVRAFEAMSDYDGYTMDTTDTNIPWIALTDPAEYKRQCDAEKAERKREEAARQAVYHQQREAEERRALAALKAKYEA